jgi:hypothetical protein
VFGFGPLAAGVLLVQTTEDEPAGTDDDAPMTLTEFQESIRRVLGAELPVAEVFRLSRYGFQARQAERYRDRRTQAQVALRRGQDPAAEALRELFQDLLAGEPSRRLGAMIADTDIRYPGPGSGSHALTGTFVSDLVLHTGQGTTSVAELMPSARPVLLDLADRPELREIARDWQHRVDIHTAETDHRPADALLIRPDAHIAWAVGTGELAGIATPALREALCCWFGTPEA